MTDDIHKDFDHAVQDSRDFGGNPFHVLSDDYGWSPDEVKALARAGLEHRDKRLRSAAKSFLHDFDEDFFGLGEIDVEDETPFGTGD